MQKLFAEKQAVLAKKWFDSIAQSYHPDTAGFLKKEKNQFANPVGHTFANETEGLLECLLSGGKPEDICGHLEKIIKITSVQEGLPSKAVSFLYFLKDIVRSEFSKDIEVLATAKEIAELERRIDQATLYAFDIHSACREKLYQLRVNEVKRSVSTVLKRTTWFDDGDETKKKPIAGDILRHTTQRGGDK